MSAIDLLNTFRELHERARRGGLPAPERQIYLKSREQLAQALVVAQGMSLLKGKSARQSFRVAVMRKVELTGATRTTRAVTMDMSAGGFSAILDVAPEMNERITATLDLGLSEPFIAKTKVVNTREHPINSRVSFAFEGLPEALAEQLELFLFDNVLARLKG